MFYVKRPLISVCLATLAPFLVFAESPVIEMKTNHGTVRIELDEGKAPISSANFLKYVRSHFYDGTVFHRVIPDFMIQGGGFAKESEGIQQKEPLAPIKNEAKNGLKNLRGTIAMARTNAPHSASSQFFINVKDNENLDHPSFDGWGYAVFGKVIEGMEVVDQIRNQKTTIKKLKARLPNGSLYPNDFRDVPVDDVMIESVSVMGDAKDDSDSGESVKTEDSSSDRQSTSLEEE